MSAPVFWIVIPLGLSALMLFFLRFPTFIRILGIITSLVLALVAVFQPIGDVLKVGNLAIDISSEFFIFGRSLLLENSDRFALSLVYSSLFLFLLVMDTRVIPAKFVPLSISVASVLISALAVRPFLYAAVLMELAVLLIILMVREKERQPVTGITRFLIYFTLAIPGILFAGWILGGSQTMATAEARMISAVVFLIFGFSIWLAVFPFHSWLPQFSRAINPFIFSFIFGVIPVVTLLVIMKYLSSLLWLRSSEFLSPAFQVVGVIMVVTTGVLASVEKDLKRFLAYPVLLETGFSLTMLSLRSEVGLLLLYESFIPRIISLALFGYSLMVLSNNSIELSIDGIRGVIKKIPLATTGVLVSILSTVGFPIFAGFPIRLELLNLLSKSSQTSVVWLVTGLIGALVGVTRIFVHFAHPVNEKWQINEKISQIVVIVFGVLLLIAMGILPRISADLITPFSTDFPVLW